MTTSVNTDAPKQATGSQEKSTPEVEVGEPDLLLNSLENIKQLKTYVDAMIDHITDKGMPFPPAALQYIQTVNPNAKVIIDAYDELRETVKPAIPETILDFRESRKGFFRFLGPIFFVKLIMAITAVTVPLLIISFLLKQAEAPIFGSQTQIVLEQFTIIFMALLGACFAALVQAEKYTKDFSFNKSHIPSYSIRFIWGSVGGYLLATWLTPEVAVAGATNYLTLGSMKIPVALIAFLAAYSGDLILRVLERLVAGVDAVLRGSAKEQTTAAESRSKAEADVADAKMRLELSRKLGEIAGNPALDKQLVKEKLEAIMAELAKFKKAS